MARSPKRIRCLLAGVAAVVALLAGAALAEPALAANVDTMTLPAAGTLTVEVTTTPAGAYDPRWIMFTSGSDDSLYLCETGNCAATTWTTPARNGGSIFNFTLGENDGAVQLSEDNHFTLQRPSGTVWLFTRAANPAGFTYTVKLTFAPTDTTPTTPTPTVTPTVTPTPTPTGTPTPIPRALWAGEFIQVRGAPPDYPSSGEQCTTGFAVSKGTDPWMLTAQHCRAGMAIVNVWKTTRPVNTTLFAGRISCGNGLLVGCIPGRYHEVDLPRPGDKVKAWPSGDYFAWHPDPAQYRAEATVMTGRGLLPVLGYADLRPGDRVCHFGQGSNGEECGKFKNTAPNGWYGVDTRKAIGGDSGGPAYTFVKDQRGRVIGVNAVGLVEVDFYADGKNRAVGGMSVAPIRMIEQELGVKLMTRS